MFVQWAINYLLTFTCNTEHFVAYKTVEKRAFIYGLPAFRIALLPCIKDNQQPKEMSQPGNTEDVLISSL